MRALVATRASHAKVSIALTKKYHAEVERPLDAGDRSQRERFHPWWHFLTARRLALLCGHALSPIRGIGGRRRIWLRQTNSGGDTTPPTDLSARLHAAEGITFVSNRD